VIAMLVALLVLAAMVLTGSLAHAVGNAIGVGSDAVTVWNAAKWPVIVALALVMIDVLFYVAPDVEGRRWRWITPGAVFALALWALASVGFAFYVNALGSYNKTYGTLGGVVILLVWLWITNLALLLGLTLQQQRDVVHDLGRLEVRGVESSHAA